MFFGFISAIQLAHHSVIFVGILYLIFLLAFTSTVAEAQGYYDRYGRYQYDSRYDTFKVQKYFFLIVAWIICKIFITHPIPNLYENLLSTRSTVCPSVERYFSNT